MTATASPLVDAHNTLGEGVLWCDRSRALYWTDIRASTLWRYQPDGHKTERWTLPERVACLALCEADGWLLLGLASRLAFFHLDTEQLIPITEVEADLPTRLNDGACDRQGRFVFGTLHEAPDGEDKKPLGSFYRLHHDLTLERLPLQKVAISNSIAFSPDGATMYFCDSLSKKIQCCDYGDTLSEPRLFVDVTSIHGDPDGSTVDAEGGLWNAQWGMRRVVRYHSDGREHRVIDVPTAQPTRPALGGDDLCTLYITSARDGLDHNALKNDPHAGALFALQLNSPGLKEARFPGTPSISVSSVAAPVSTSTF